VRSRLALRVSSLLVVLPTSWRAAGAGLPGFGALAGWAAFAPMFRNPR